MSRFTDSKLAAQAIHAWRRSHILRHLIEMYLAMQIGMAVGSLSFAVALGASTGEARQQHPVAFLLVMALSMTFPMVAWMLHRGHSRRSAAEMAAVMLAPALPFIGLQMSHVISASGCGGYMSVSTIAMVALIVYRRSEYRATAEAHGAKAGSRTAQRHAVHSDPQAVPLAGERSSGNAQLQATSPTALSNALNERGA